MKLFITDYDDTLYTDDTQIKKNIAKIKKLQQESFIITISTGRSYPSIKTKINEYQIPYDYLCCADGSIIYDKKGNIIEKYVLDEKIVKILEKFYQNLDYEEIQFSYPSGYENYLQKGSLLGINICLSTDKLTDNLKENFLNLQEKYPQYNFLCYQHTNYCYLCVKPQNVSKSLAITHLKNILKIAIKDIYVIGDSENDVEMIKDFNGVGMTNSCNKVLKVAKKCFDTVENYIDEILKEK